MLFAQIMSFDRFIQSKCKQNKNFEMEADIDVYSHLFFSTQTYYLNAYPVINRIADDPPTIIEPEPLSLIGVGNTFFFEGSDTSFYIGLFIWATRWAYYGFNAKSMQKSN